METLSYIGIWVTTLLFTFFIIYSVYTQYKTMISHFECKSVKSKILCGIISLIVVSAIVVAILSVICAISKEFFLVVILFIFGGYIGLIE